MFLFCFWCVYYLIFLRFWGSYLGSDLTRQLRPLWPDKWSEKLRPSPSFLTDGGMFVYQSKVRHILIDYLITNTLMGYPRYRTALEICLITPSWVEILMNKRYLLMNRVKINQRANVFGTYLKCVYFQSRIRELISYCFLSSNEL